MLKIKDIPDPVVLGTGVLLFPGVLDVDVPQAVSVCEQLVSDEFASQYSPAFNEQTGEDEYVNRSGYFFSKESLLTMPRRCTTAHESDSEQVVKMLTTLESAKDECIIRYIAMYPIVLKTIWWKIKGHIVSYSPNRGGIYLGPHSDNSVDYKYGFPHPSRQIATRGVVSCLCYINSQGDNDYGFTGGDHYFNYLDISYSPKSGDILMFPSNFIAAHEVKPVESGNRYSYLGWYSHGTPNPEVGEHVSDPNTEDTSKQTNVYMPDLEERVRAYTSSEGAKYDKHLVNLI
jgi:hypothetical protein